MSEATFVSEEKSSARSRHQGVLRLNLRLFADLPIFLRILPLSLLTIVLASVAPSFFRWYSGKFAAGEGEFRLPPGLDRLASELPFSLTGVGVILGLAIFFRIAAWALFETSGMWATLGIHGRMVRALGRTRTTFFDENPSGRLINRLIRDYDEVRSTAVIFVGDFLNAMVEIFAVAGVAYLASPLAATLILPLLVLFFYIQYHRSGMIDHSRTFSAVGTSQVIARQTDLIEGLEVYLLYGKSARLLQRLAGSFSHYIRASALTNQIETWASFWMRSSAETFSFGVLIFVVHALARGEIDAPLAGVMISALFGTTSSIGWLDFASGLISRSAPHIRRVYDFVDLPEESSEENAPPAPDAASAPLLSLGRAPEIEFRNYSMSYRKDTPLILDRLSVRFPAGQKTALIGRTGSGKTSVIQALLRMVYLREGEILLDGESVFGRELRSLRREFGVVPQFPYLFEGTLRSNLDRTGTAEDPPLEESLRAVGLQKSLDFAVAEGGTNLSLGERQLICLARVLASGKKIVLMDEPTSGLDPETDYRVSQVLRRAFAGKTLVTVAHRLDSLGDYDRVVEMSGGRVVWEGTPAELAARG